MRHHKRKTTRGVWSEASLRAAVREHLEAGLSIRKAASNHNLNYKTLSRYVKDAKRNPEEQVAKKVWAHPRILSERMEKSLVEYAQKAASIYHGITMDVLRKLAYQMATCNGVENIPSNWHAKQMAGVDWATGFLSRHGELSLRKPEATSIQRMAAFNRHNVNAFMDNLSEIYSRATYGPHQIWNLDETGCTTVQRPSKILATKGCKQVGAIVSQERGTLVTVCCAINALGNHIPPFFVFPRVKVQDNWLLTAPPGSSATGHPKASGWMTEENFLQYMQHFVKYAKPSAESPIVLLLDNHQSHTSIEVIDYAKENNITLLSFPQAHCSHRLQPLDVGVYGPFKAYYNQAADNWMRENPAQPMTIHVIPKLVAYALPKAMTPSNILSGFRSTGIFPFDRNIFGDDAFMASYVTDRPDPHEIAREKTADTNCNEESGRQPKDAGDSLASSSTSQAPASSNSVNTDACTFQTPEDIHPFSQIGPRKTKSSQDRRKGRTLIYTDTPVKEQLLAERSSTSKAKKPRKTLFPTKQAPTPKPKPDDPSSSSSDSDSVEIDDSSGSEMEEDVEIIEGDFVIVKVPGKKCVLHYVARVDVVGSEDYEGIFLKRMNGPKRADDGLHSFIPNPDDEAFFTKADIVHKLPTPAISGASSRRKLVFKTKSIEQYDVC